MIILSGKATEKSSVGIKFTFTKEDGTSPTIDSMTWTLTDMSGNIINDREQVSVTSPTAEQTIILSGDDLALSVQDNDYEWRVLTIEATYTPISGGSSVPLRESARFVVSNLIAIT
jgi:PHD/YefM family antitoxin component YafN of YafNO toxin-antitoxin module